jgi:hypothetical protein
VTGDLLFFCALGESLWFYSVCSSVVASIGYAKVNDEVTYSFKIGSYDLGDERW